MLKINVFHLLKFRNPQIKPALTIADFLNEKNRNDKYIKILEWIKTSR